ncbi:MAG TPA: transporter [Chitinophaga sp.]|uniref:SphA family protein n=1 Tax=Chitinophaga sp. TaxID=1869181 RepID=UPI002C8666B7|nr:transporter [Chitinophaga sp.]HVI49245.1 transporter [Chitinophaga sp.]
MWLRNIITATSLFLLTTFTGAAQDPSLPATNLGMANMQDGVSPGPGLYYVHYLQIYQPQRLNDVKGRERHGVAEISSLLSMHQFIYESSVRVFGGNLAFSALLPVVKLSAGKGGSAPSVNPGVIGGLIFGPVVQWSNRKLFGMAYWHRVEVDLSAPLGAYNPQYDVNPSSRFYTLTGYYAFTLFPAKNFSISTRNNFNYNFRKIGTDARSGMFYNINFSAEQRIVSTLRAEVAGYYLKQLAQDDFRGDHQYYQRTYGISDTREQVLAIGPGISYVTKGGLAAELKVFFETAARNRPEGVRPTLRVAYKIK